jgi:hypothetical protein
MGKMEQKCARRKQKNSPCASFLLFHSRSSVHGKYLTAVRGKVFHFATERDGFLQAGLKITIPRVLRRWSMLTLSDKITT